MENDDKKKCSFPKTFVKISTAWNLFAVIYYRIIEVRFAFPTILIPAIISVILIPLMITSVTCLWYTKEKRAKKVNRYSGVFLLIVLIYILYVVISLIFYAEVVIESDRILNKITFIKKSSYLPCLPHKKERTISLEEKQAFESDSFSTTLHLHKQSANDLPVLIPWGNYDIYYSYGAKGQTYTKKTGWYFKKFKDTPPLFSFR